MQTRIKNKKVLFPVADREVNATEGRLLKLLRRLTDSGYSVDILTFKDEVFEKAKDIYKDNALVEVMLTKPDDRFWTMVDRDSFAKTFIKLNHDLVTPGTDMKFWKQVAFDDFLWHVSTSVFPKITRHYDVVLLPVTSVEDYDKASDVFYTNIVFYAKENNVPLAGLQIFPVYTISPIFPRILDYFIVKEEFERDYFKGIGIKDEKIITLTDLKDSYCISTIEDPYKNLIFDEQLTVDKDGLGIVIVNNSKNRLQLYEVIDAVGGADIKKTVFFSFLDFSVKELHEKDIFDDLIRPRLERSVKQFYTVDAGGVIKVLMACDVIIATNYMVSVSFADRYNKLGIVHNPLKKEIPYMKEVTFTTSKQALKELIVGQYKKKQKTISTIAESIDRILG